MPVDAEDAAVVERRRWKIHDIKKKLLHVKCTNSTGLLCRNAFPFVCSGHRPLGRHAKINNFAQYIKCFVFQ